ncbi:MAG: hypothetical protein ACKOED_06945 [Aestuariivirga sp.]|uniref:hypothetical protein n=1 Tax=Aestuariivirga sp. TaxID=2650926 RepID=UPI0038CFBF4C
MRVFAVSICLVLCAVAPAVAGQTEAKECAAGLDDKSKMIFNAVLPKVTPGAKLKGELASATKELVKSGKIPRADAKAAATAAAKCLKLGLQ